MGIVGASLGFAAAGTLVFAMATSSRSVKHPDSVMTAFAMVLVWAVSMLADEFLAPPESKLLNPIMDVVLATGIGLAWLTHKEIWKVVLLALISLQCLMHVVYQTEFRAPGVLYNYVLGLNLTYLAELVCIATPGAANVAHWIGDQLRARRAAPARVGARP